MSEKNKFKGKDVEEAITMACENLDVSRDKLNIEIVSPGSKGIFGLGRKKAVILATKKSSARATRSDSAEKKIEPQAIKKNGKKNSDIPLLKKKAKKIDSLLERADEALTQPPPPEVVEEVKSLLQKMVELMGFPSEVTTTTSGNKISAHISGDFVKDLIGRDGDTLDAIQYLMRKMISQKRYADKLFFSLDCGDFRDSRKSELQGLALEMATKVKETGKTQTIAALNPAERRIVHVTLQDDKRIRSSSVGEGLYKKIRIFVPGKGRKKSSRDPRTNKNRATSNGSSGQTSQAVN